MTPLYTADQYTSAKSGDKLPLECKCCKKEFLKTKRYISQVVNGKNTRDKCEYCSLSCGSMQTLPELHNCKQCGKDVYRKPYGVQESTHVFCSKSCAATYNNTHKTTGTRRSKLEVWLSVELPKIYPNLEIKFNSKTYINSELDIYFPSLRIAFELNGIYHYEPIHGEEKLASVQNNDSRKFAACLENNINLCIIDVSGLKYFKESNARKYLDIITKIIDNAIN